SDNVVVIWFVSECGLLEIRGQKGFALLAFCENPDDGVAMVRPGARSLLDAYIRAVTIEVMVHFCLLHVRRRHDGGETSCGRPHLVSPRRPSRPRLTCEQLDLRQRGIHPLDGLVSFVRLSAVLTARCANNRWRAIGW